MTDLDDSTETPAELAAQRDAQGSASPDPLLDALDALRSAAASRIDLAANLDDDENAPPSVLHAVSRARTRDDAASTLSAGDIGTGRLLRGTVAAALAELAQAREEFSTAAAAVVEDDDLSESGRQKRLSELRDDFERKARQALDDAGGKVEGFAAARERALVSRLTPAADTPAPDRLDALAARVDALALVLASSRADDAAYEAHARALILRGDPRAAALLEAGAAQGRGPLLLRRLAVTAKTHASNQTRSAAADWLGKDPARLVDAAELRWVRELRRQARFALDAARRDPTTRPILPSHFEIS